MSTLTYPFTAAEAQAAYQAWGANCGPTSLAFVLGVSLDAVRPLLAGFDEKRYTNPTMMGDALRDAGAKRFEVRHPTRNLMCSTGLPSLVRIQWKGPWTAPGANPRWAYRQSHWIVAWSEETGPHVFDCNAGIVTLSHWELVTVPAITAMYPRADGGWYPTHVWRVQTRQIAKQG